MRLYNWKELEAIIFELKLNKIAIVDTDTVKGFISCRPHLIYEIKNRSQRKKLILLINNYNQIPFNLPKDLQALLNNFWPGPLTIVYRKQSYRMPNYLPLLQLIKQIGAVYSSSANISGQMPVKSIAEIQKQFAKKMNRLIVIEAEKNAKNNDLNNQASTIYDYDQKKVLRVGQISVSKIKQFVYVKN